MSLWICETFHFRWENILLECHFVYLFLNFTFFTFRTYFIFGTGLVPLLWKTIPIHYSSEPTISKTILSSFRTRTSHFQLRPTTFRIPDHLLNFQPYPYFLRTRTPGSEVRIRARRSGYNLTLHISLLEITITKNS